jgi:YcxB-like protein
MTQESDPKVTFSVTPEELFCFEWGHFLREHPYLLGGYYLLVIAVAFYTAFALWKGSLLAGLAFAVFAAVFAPVFFRWLLRKKTQRTFRSIPVQTRQSTIELSPSGIRQRGEYGEGSFHWAALHRVVGTREQIALYLNRRIAIAIPRRAFPTPASADAFLEAARTWHAAATAKGQPETNTEEPGQ